MTFEFWNLTKEKTASADYPPSNDVNEKSKYINNIYQNEW